MNSLAQSFNWPRIKPSTSHIKDSWSATKYTPTQCFCLTHTHWYKVVQIWPGLFVCKQVTVCPGHIWTTLYIFHSSWSSWPFVRFCKTNVRVKKLKHQSLYVDNFNFKEKIKHKVMYEKLKINTDYIICNIWVSLWVVPHCLWVSVLCSHLSEISTKDEQKLIKQCCSL
jgi:hypothetical protein